MHEFIYISQSLINVNLYTCISIIVVIINLNILNFLKIHKTQKINRTEMFRKKSTLRY